MDLPRKFQFERDTFAFANELVREYRFDPQTGSNRSLRREPPPTYVLHCFVLVRSARQFFHHAHFDPTQPAVDSATYRALICQVVARNPRTISPANRKIVIPGYNCLRAFSIAHEPSLKDSCGGAWQSYVLRSHWRMVFPISRTHQMQTAEKLSRSLETGGIPVIHLVRFPQLTINHGMLLYAQEQVSGETRFTAYDPNVPAQPTIIAYHHDRRTFTLPANMYWPGGELDIIEIFRGWFY